jgi:hypothetical protein
MHQWSEQIFMFEQERNSIIPILCIVMFTKLVYSNDKQETSKAELNQHTRTDAWQSLKTLLPFNIRKSFVIKIGIAHMLK